MSDYDINSEDDLDFGSDEELGEGSGASAEDDSDGEEGSGGSSEDQVEFNAAYDEEELDEMFDEEDEEEEAPRRRKTKGRSADEEAEYELAGRTRWTPKPPKPEEDSVEVGRLPIKLPTGEVQMVEGSTRIALPQGKKKKQAEPPSDEDEEDEEEEEEEGSDDGRQAEQMAGQKGKFGRMGVAEIVGTPGWKNAQRLVAAKEQIALIGAEILGGGELMDNVRSRSTSALDLTCF
jgi:nucleolar complex protein 3